MKILHLDSSVMGEQSVSRPLTKATVARLKELHPEAEVTYRDLVEQPLQHSTAAARRFGADVSAATPAEKQEMEAGLKLFGEFEAANVVVLGAPMYNFNIPSQLKAWIDNLCVPGKAFTYSSAGPKGLLGGRRVIVVSSRGGQYGPGSPYEAADFQEKYLKTVFGFLGITELEIIRAEGLGSPDQRDKAVASAKEQIAALK